MYNIVPNEVLMSLSGRSLKPCMDGTSKFHVLNKDYYKAKYNCLHS